MNGLRLDRKKEALAGGHSGPAILRGNSADSRLIHLVAGYRVKVVMPPAGPALSAEEIGILRAWIDQGAKWPEPSATAVAEPAAVQEHWAWQPRSKPAPPRVRRTEWPHNAIDEFVLRRLEDEDVSPSPEADKLTLLRRVSLDLTGLPPTPDRIERFLLDSRPDAYERLVDEALASPHFGEKWASHWLDQVRYADSDGYEKDDPRPWAWRYRDWVIDALNRDMPFDQFSIEQIAGDLLPNATAEQRVATGMHRNTLKNREGGVNPEQFRFEETVDRASTVATVWLGLTAGCAQCHDHKYDPIAQRDYYRFFSILSSMEEDLTPAPLPGEMGPYLRTADAYRARREELLREHKVPELQPAWEEKVRYAAKHPGEHPGWDVNFDTLSKMTDGGDKLIWMPVEERDQRGRDIITDYFIRFYGQVVSKERFEELDYRQLRTRLAELRAEYPQLTKARVVYEASEPRPARLHVRGAWDRPGVEVGRGVPAFLPPIESGDPTRLDLARWIVSGDNPLTARVTVNRIWQEYFGTGLVATSNDFGTQGEAPSHPDLLDWLAEDFVRSQWNVKGLHRRIVTSATYRQSSKARPELAERDPNNRLLGRQARLRLPAETVRDVALSAAGLFYPKFGGPSIKPPQPESVSKLVYAGSARWRESKGPDRYRRGLYIHFQRMAPYPFLMNFDGAERSVAECSRERSNTPLQALNLLNDPVFHEAAQALARRALTEASGDTFGKRLDYVYRLSLNRLPAADETTRLERYLGDQKALLDASPGAAQKQFPAQLETADANEAAAWTGLAKVLLNLDEFVTRE